MTIQKEGRFVVIRGMVPHRIFIVLYDQFEQWVKFFYKLKEEYDVPNFKNVFEVVKEFTNVKLYPKCIMPDVQPSFLPKKVPTEIQFSFAFNSEEEAATFFKKIGGTLFE